MPYIKQVDRAQLNAHIDRLAKEIKAIMREYSYEASFAGLLNYACTTLALKVLPSKRYWVLALASGVFHNIADEFYRRYAVPYEDEQIKNNGDVY